jgi:hypothetical protein
MAIKSEIETTVFKKENQLTFPALYIWAEKGEYFGEVVLFSSYTSSVVLLSTKNSSLLSAKIGFFSDCKKDCRDIGWRRLAVGERIFLENSD